MEMQSSDKSIIGRFELSVLKLSEVIDKKIADTSNRALDFNQKATQAAYSALQSMKEGQADLLRSVQKLKKTAGLH